MNGAKLFIGTTFPRSATAKEWTALCWFAPFTFSPCGVTPKNYTAAAPSCSMCRDRMHSRMTHYQTGNKKGESRDPPLGFGSRIAPSSTHVSRLFVQVVFSCRTAFLVVEDDVHRFAIGGHGRIRHTDDLPVPFVGLLNRVRIDLLQRDHRLAGITVDGVVFPIKLRIVALALWVGHFQPIAAPFLRHRKSIL